MDTIDRVTDPLQLELGRVYLYGRTFHRIVEVRDPRHGLAAAHGLQVVDVEVWITADGRWSEPHPVTVAPWERRHVWQYLSDRAIASCDFPR